MYHRKWISNNFRSLPADKREKIIGEIKKSSSPGFDYFLLVFLSSIIATFGLITDSPAVIIGAMLVAPLMTPIVAIGLASNTGDENLLSASLSSLVRGASLAILISTLLSLAITILPFVSLQEIPNEVIARTRPTPIDLGIALAGGLAAAYALSTPNLLAALPGVAISTAILPPLCTIGIGIALGRWDISGGAGLIFITNTVTIAFASALVFFLLGFYPRRRVRTENHRIPGSLKISAILTIIILLSLSYTGYRFFKQSSENRLINTIVNAEVKRFGNASLISLDVSRVGERYHIDITIRTNSPLKYQNVVDLQESIAYDIGKPVSLSINQIFAEKLDPLVPPTPTLTFTPTLSKTPGPSPTYTFTNTIMPTQTFTPTPSLTPTPTNIPTLTSTPATARIQLSPLPRLQLYQSPNGPVIGSLSRGQILTVYYDTVIEKGIVWINVMDDEGRLGWIPQIYVEEYSPTVTSPPTSTSTIMDNQTSTHTVVSP